MKTVFLLLVGLFLGLTLAIPGLADGQATQLVNQLRAQNGQSAIRYSSILEQVAAAHAQDMRRMGQMTHDGSDGSGPGDRASRQGYDWCYVSENVAVGHRDLAEVIAAWANSPGHRANMLHRKAREFGVARANGNYWAMVLAEPGCG